MKWDKHIPSNLPFLCLILISIENSSDVLNLEADAFQSVEILLGLKVWTNKIATKLCLKNQNVQFFTS